MRKAAAAAGILTGLCLLAGCGKEQVQPEQLLTEYIQLLNEGNYEEMYSYLSEAVSYTHLKENRGKESEEPQDGKHE